MNEQEEREWKELYNLANKMIEEFMESMKGDWFDWERSREDIVHTVFLEILDEYDLVPREAKLQSEANKMLEEVAEIKTLQAKQKELVNLLARRLDFVENLTYGQPH